MAKGNGFEQLVIKRLDDIDERLRNIENENIAENALKRDAENKKVMSKETIRYWIDKFWPLFARAAVTIISVIAALLGYHHFYPT